MTCSSELSKPRRSWRTPEFISHWSEVQLTLKACGLGVVLWRTLSLTSRVCSNSEDLVSELNGVTGHQWVSENWCQVNEGEASGHRCQQSFHPLRPEQLPWGSNGAQMWVDP